MEHPVREQVEMNSDRCPECKRTGKIQHNYSAGNHYVPMILTQCDFCKQIICASCWEKHYFRHTGVNPQKERYYADSKHFDVSGALSDMLERDSSPIHSDLAPGARVSISLPREEVSRLHSGMRTRIRRIKT